MLIQSEKRRPSPAVLIVHLKRTLDTLRHPGVSARFSSLCKSPAVHIIFGLRDLHGVAANIVRSNWVSIMPNNTINAHYLSR